MFLSAKAATIRSALVRLIRSMFGDVNCSHVLPLELDNDKFVDIGLFGKWINSVGDVWYEKPSHLDIFFDKSR
jgi:hypothetical protein